MRFGDGAWRMLDGVVPTYLARIDGVERTDTELLLHVSSRPETERWATLAGDMFSIRVSSPGEGVLRVQTSHHLGRKRLGPNFELNVGVMPLAIAETDSELSVVVELQMLEKGAAETLNDRTEDLAVQRSRIDDAAHILDRHVFENVDMPAFRIDRDARGIDLLFEILEKGCFHTQ